MRLSIYFLGMILATELWAAPVKSVITPSSAPELKAAPTLTPIPGIPKATGSPHKAPSAPQGPEVTKKDDQKK